MRIRSLDHLVLTVQDIGRTVSFYEQVLGMEHCVSGERHALHFGTQKINLHAADHTFEPKAAFPTPGSGDLCFLTDAATSAVLDHLERTGTPVVEGPVKRTGAVSPLTSVYVRDPDGNLVEIATVSA